MKIIPRLTSRNFDEVEPIKKLLQFKAIQAQANVFKHGFLSFIEGVDELFLLLFCSTQYAQYSHPKTYQTGVLTLYSSTNLSRVG